MIARILASVLFSYLHELFGKTDTIKERNRNIVDAHLRHGYKQSEISNYLGVHYVTISRIINESNLQC